MCKHDVSVKLLYQLKVILSVSLSLQGRGGHQERQHGSSDPDFQHGGPEPGERTSTGPDL